MTKVVPFRNTDESSKRPKNKGPKKVRRKSKVDPEDFGQLNLFDESRQIQLVRGGYFDEVLVLDEHNDPRAADFYLKAIANKDSVSDVSFPTLIHSVLS